MFIKKVECSFVNEQVQCWFDKFGLLIQFLDTTLMKFHNLIFIRCKRGNWKRNKENEGGQFFRASISPFAAPMMCV